MNAESNHKMRFIIFLAFLTVDTSANSGPMLPTGPTGKEELALEPSDQANFDVFKDAVLTKLTCPDMKKDIYLVKFFKNAGMDVDTAKTQLDVALQIRTDNNIDSITNLDFATNDEGTPKFNSSMKEVDRKGRLVLYVNPVGWPLKTALAKGEGPKYEGNMYRLLEAAVTAVIKNYESGKESAQLIVLVNHEGWTDDEGGAGCLECAPFMTKIAGNIFKTWPNWINKIGLVNTSPESVAFVDIIKLVFPTSLQAEIYTYGREKSEWWPKVVSLIPEKALKKLIKK